MEDKNLENLILVKDTRQDFSKFVFIFNHNLNDTAIIKDTDKSISIDIKTKVETYFSKNEKIDVYQLVLTKEDIADIKKICLDTSQFKLTIPYGELVDTTKNKNKLTLTVAKKLAMFLMVLNMKKAKNIFNKIKQSKDTVNTREGEKYGSFFWIFNGTFSNFVEGFINEQK